MGKSSNHDSRGADEGVRVLTERVVNQIIECPAAEWGIFIFRPWHESFYPALCI